MPERGIPCGLQEQLSGVRHAAAVYMRARAEQAAPGDIDVFARESERQGLSVWGIDEVTEPAKHRLYRAIATEHYTLGPGDERVPQSV